MSDELKTSLATTGLSGTTYVLRSSDLMQAWRVDTGVFETYNGANAAHYQIAASERPTGQGWYVASAPGALPAGSHPFDLLDAAGNKLASGLLAWNGTAELGTQQAVDLLEADRWIDTGTTPWDFVLIKRGSGALGTGTELLRQKLYDPSGAAIAAGSTVIGRATT